MKNQNLQKLYYRLKRDVLTTNNLIMMGAVVIAVSWAWGSVSVMDRNYKLQRELDDKSRQAKLVQLEKDTLQYQQNYFKSDEYKELAARQTLGLVAPGESVLILPPNSAAAQSEDNQQAKTTPKPVVQQSNFQLWMNFLFSGKAGGL